MKKLSKHMLQATWLPFRGRLKEALTALRIGFRKTTETSTEIVKPPPTEVAASQVAVLVDVALLTADAAETVKAPEAPEAPEALAKAEAPHEAETAPDAIELL